LKKIEAAIFDLDGVLVDSERVHHEVWQEVIREFGGGKITNKQFSKLIGHHGSVVSKWAVKEFGLSADPERISNYKRAKVKRELAKRVTARTGAREFLQKIHGKVKTGVASTSRPAYVRMVLRKTELAKYIDEAVGRERGFRSKPAPDIYLAAARRLGVKPVNCLAFEDTCPGARAAKAAGMKLVVVTHRYTHDHHFKGAKLRVRSWRSPKLGKLARELAGGRGAELL